MLKNKKKTLKKIYNCPPFGCLLSATYPSLGLLSSKLPRLWLPLLRPPSCQLICFAAMLIIEPWKQNKTRNNRVQICINAARVHELDAFGCSVISVFVLPNLYQFLSICHICLALRPSYEGHFLKMDHSQEQEQRPKAQTTAVHDAALAGRTKNNSK